MGRAVQAGTFARRGTIRGRVDELGQVEEREDVGEVVKAIEVGASDTEM